MEKLVPAPDGLAQYQSGIDNGKNLESAKGPVLTSRPLQRRRKFGSDAQTIIPVALRLGAVDGLVGPRGHADRPVGQCELFHQQNGAGSFDLAGDFAVGAGRHASHTTRQDFSAFRDKTTKEFGVFVIDGL